MRKCLLLVALALAGFAGTARAAPLQSHAAPVAYLQYRAVSVQPTPDAAAGKAEADLAFQAGFNTLRVIMPWSYPWQADAVNDAPRICSVAAEAANLHMALFLDLLPIRRAPPVSSRQITRYTTTIGAYMSYLIGPLGCAQGLAELDIQVDNEPNYPVFRPQATAPQDYTHLLIRTYKAVRLEAQRKGYTVPVKVIGGELASSHDPAGFMDRMRDAAQAWHYHGPFFDLFSYHCYGVAGEAPTPPDRLQVRMVADFGQAMPLLCSEYAVATASRTLSSAAGVRQSESLQAQLFCQAEAMSLDKGLAGFAWFRLFDDPAGAPTGLYYSDPALGQPGDQPIAKSSLPAVRQCNTAASPPPGATAAPGGTPSFDKN